VPVIDAVGLVAAKPRHRGRELVSVEDLDDVGMLAYLDDGADEPGRDGVCLLAEVDRAPLPNDDLVRGVLRQPAGRQRREVLPLLCKARGGGSIELLANLLDEREIALYGGEVAAATQDQLLLERGLEPVVGLLHDAVLVGFARLDACRAHSVVVEHCLEPAVELAPALG